MKSQYKWRKNSEADSVRIERERKKSEKEAIADLLKQQFKIESKVVMLLAMKKKGRQILPAPTFSIRLTNGYFTRRRLTRPAKPMQTNIAPEAGSGITFRATDTVLD